VSYFPFSRSQGSSFSHSALELALAFSRELPLLFPNVEPPLLFAGSGGFPKPHFPASHSAVLVFRTFRFLFLTSHREGLLRLWYFGFISLAFLCSPEIFLASPTSACTKSFGNPGVPPLMTSTPSCSGGLSYPFFFGSPRDRPGAFVFFFSYYNSRYNSPSGFARWFLFPASPANHSAAEPVKTIHLSPCATQVLPRVFLCNPF